MMTYEEQRQLCMMVWATEFNRKRLKGTKKIKHGLTRFSQVMFDAIESANQVVIDLRNCYDFRTDFNKQPNEKAPCGAFV